MQSGLMRDFSIPNSFLNASILIARASQADQERPFRAHSAYDIRISVLGKTQRPRKVL